MRDREMLLDRFLAKTIWQDWTRTPIAGDASTRSYRRLSQDGQSVIVMDDPTPGEKPTTQFATIAKHLTMNGFCAPHVLAHDATNGLMVLTDLGDDDFVATINRRPTAEQSLYNAATDLLIALSQCELPKGLTQLTPEIGAQMIAITGEYYGADDISIVQDALHDAMNKFAANADTLSLRDFHAENLIWRDAHGGANRIGLLDFQDAFIAPAGYDLASLLRDARRDVPAQIVDATINRFIEKSNAGPSLRTQIACLGIQRNLRILGVFARLAKEHGKAHYLSFLPRVWSNILADLKDPALINLSKAVLNNIPAPTSAFCERLPQ